MAIEDFLEAFGAQTNAMGLPGRPYAPDLGTGVASALGGFAQGMKLRRALADAKRLKAARDQFTQTLGVDYDLFAKLPADAQSQILKNKGLIDDPSSHPLEQFGGRSMTQLENEGIPAQTAPALGTGAFEGLGGLGVGDQMTGPNGVGMVPLKGLTVKARADEMHNFLNQGVPAEKPGMTPEQYREERIRLARIRLKNDLSKTEQQRRESETRIKHIQAADHRRSDPTAPVDDWEVELARSMGVPIAAGVKPTRKQFDTALKVVPPQLRGVGAVIDRSYQMATAIRLAEVQQGEKMSDKDIQEFVATQGVDLNALAGPGGVAAATKGVMAKLKAMRNQPESDWMPAKDDTAIPEDLENEHDAGTESDDDGGEDEGGDY